MFSKISKSMISNCEKRERALCDYTGMNWLGEREAPDS